MKNKTKEMEMNQLEELLQEYIKAPEIYHPTRYWEDYEKEILEELKNVDFAKFRSGIYPIFVTFGFSESVYPYHAHTKAFKILMVKIIRKLVRKYILLPYALTLGDIREIAYLRCIDLGKLVNGKSIADISVSSYGMPGDLFQIKGKDYTMQFLSFYIRYCFAQKHIKFTGNEILVELGSGSGLQIEVLKKLYPDITILCFDLPGQLFICEKYLTGVFGEDTIIGTDITLYINQITQIEKGKIYFFGNWQFPLLKDQKFDIFWNSASFGEMEPNVVLNYLNNILGNFKFVYLLQARKGKESFEKSGVKEPITFADYNKMLTGYRLIEEQDAYQAHKRLYQSGGYFEAIWRKE